MSDMLSPTKKGEAKKRMPRHQSKQELPEDNPVPNPRGRPPTKKIPIRPPQLPPPKSKGRTPYHQGRLQLPHHRLRNSQWVWSLEHYLPLQSGTAPAVNLSMDGRPRIELIFLLWSSVTLLRSS